MTTYIIRRLASSLVVIGVISAIVFIAVDASGDPAVLLAPMDALPEDVQALRVRLGLDRPLPLRYARFLREALSGELRSFRHKVPPSQLIFPHLLRSMQLAIPSLVIATIIAIPFGMIAAIRRGTAPDGTILSIALIGQATPLFLICTALIWIFAVQLKWLPVSGRGSILHFVLPVLSLTAFNMAVLLRLTRSSVLDILGLDFLRTARAKGLPAALVNIRHALPNALLPIISAMGVRLGAMLSGVIVVEVMFAWPGIGKLLYDAVLQRDIPIVVVGSLVIAVMVSILNLLVDLSYAAIDPRIRYS